MNKKLEVSIFVFALFLIPVNIFALSPEAEQGKVLSSVCTSCHNDQLSPPLAAALFGISRKYHREYPDKESFVKAVADYVAKPEKSKALMKGAVSVLGVMPAMPLPKEMLQKLGAWLYETEFPPPCKHWANELAREDSKPHGKNVRRNYERFCKD